MTKQERLRLLNEIKQTARELLEDKDVPPNQLEVSGLRSLESAVQNAINRIDLLDKEMTP
jgi:hypothetical protein